MILLVAAALLIGAAAIPVGRVLAAPGAAPWSVRTVDWLRSSGFGPLVDLIENWYYTRHAPPDVAPVPSTLPSWSGAQTGMGRGSLPDGPARLPLDPGRQKLPGEGSWSAARTDRQGIPLIYTAYFRPDPAHASVVAGVAWIRRSGTRVHLVAGTIQPGGGGWPGHAAVPTGAVGRLVATFNSGWRMQDLDGGFYLGERSSAPLVTGDATDMVDDQGRLMGGAVGPRCSPKPALGRRPAESEPDRRPRAGRLGPGPQRSGSLGQTRTISSSTRHDPRHRFARERNLRCGHRLNLAVLGEALHRAGAVRAMQLDIHRQMIHFASWRTSPTGAVTPTKLLPAMTQRADRYLRADQRDFFYVTAAPSAG